MDLESILDELRSQRTQTDHAIAALQGNSRGGSLTKGWAARIPQSYFHHGLSYEKQYDQLPSAYQRSRFVLVVLSRYQSIQTIVAPMQADGYILVSGADGRRFFENNADIKRRSWSCNRAIMFGKSLSERNLGRTDVLNRIET